MENAEKTKKSFAGRTAGIVYLSCIVLCVAAVLFFSLRTEAVEIYTYNVTYRGETTEHTSEIYDTAAILTDMGIDTENITYTESADNRIITVTVTDMFLFSVTESGRTSFLSVEDGTTIADALSLLGISVDEDDRVSADISAAISENTEISVVYVTTELTHKDVAIPHGTEKVANENMDKGKSNVKTEGVDGVKLLTYKSVYVEGVLESYELESEETVTEPVTEVIEYGTKEKKPEPAKKPSSSSSNKKPSSSSSSSKPSSSKPSASKKPSYTTSKNNKYKDNGDGTVTTFDGTVLKYSKVVELKATAYTYMNNKMDITASGVPVQVGIVAAHKKTLPMGTRVYIVSKYGTWEYGVAKVGDTGCGEGKVDLFMTSYDECMDFGVRGAKVYILE